jgi:Domain of unknown function (DUF4193)
MVIRTDYDAPRTSVTELETESLELLTERRMSVADDLSEPDYSVFDLPGYELIDDELTAPVVPMRKDEFFARLDAAG